MVDVFVTGGSRVLGRPVVRLLRRRGHRVRALSRGPESDGILRSDGGEPVRGDLFDAASMRAAVEGCRAVLHLATRIPPIRRANVAGAWAENDRIRSEGTRVLVDAALDAGAQVLVYPSVTFVYRDAGAAWIEAGSPITSPGITASTLVAEAEVARFGERGGRGVTLRMGAFYGPTAESARLLIATARRGLAALVGPGGAYQSSIWVEDAAAAVVAAMESAPTGVYDVVDDEPLTRRQMARALGDAIGRRHLLVRLPWPVARALGGPGAVVVGRSQRVSNRRFREATGWAPSVPSAREGLRLLASLVG
jgi:nucleoside-diphosphate-sugar epimerase